MVEKIKTITYIFVAYAIGWILGATVLWGLWNLGAALFGYGSISIAQAAMISLIADFLFVFIGRRPW